MQIDSDDRAQEQVSERSMPRSEHRRFHAKIEEAQRLARLTREQLELYLDLTELRRRLSREEGVPAYQIMGNKALLALAETAPTDLAAMARLPQVGRLRVAAYGERFLEVIRQALKGQENATPGRQAPEESLSSAFPN